MMIKHDACSVVAILLLFSVYACDKPHPQTSHSESSPTTAPATASVDTSQSSQSQPPAHADEPVSTTATLAASSTIESVQPSTTVTTVSSQTTPPEPETKTTGNDREAMLALAKKSGCLTCHAIERKIVGPAWQDVAKRYKGDGSAKAALVEKVKKGGSGKWNEITNGAKMPPYSPRVKDEDIETLVGFVLSL